jgi:hypothetical protein
MSWNMTCKNKSRKLKRLWIQLNEFNENGETNEIKENANKQQNVLKEYTN